MKNIVTVVHIHCTMCTTFMKKILWKLILEELTQALREADAKQGERLGLGHEESYTSCKGKCEEMEIGKDTLGPGRKICCQGKNREIS